jgi:DNA-binding GntR family transcriptional regulator
MKILKLPQNAPDSLTERVYRQLRSALITGEIPAGTRLVESSLAREMSVSRTPAREALHKLALEGLLYSIPRAGYIVAEMSDYDIQDLFKTRTAVEQLVARWALEHITAEEIRRLEVNLKKTDQALKSGRTESMMDLDAEFHLIIYRASRSQALYNICRGLSDHTLKYRIACIHVPEIARHARQGHHRILQALREKRPADLDRAIEIHLNQVQKDILTHLARARRESFSVHH